MHCPDGWGRLFLSHVSVKVFHNFILILIKFVDFLICFFLYVLILLFCFVLLFTLFSFLPILSVLCEKILLVQERKSNAMRHSYKVDREFVVLHTLQRRPTNTTVCLYVHVITNTNKRRKNKTFSPAWWTRWFPPIYCTVHAHVVCPAAIRTISLIPRMLPFQAI